MKRTHDVFLDQSDLHKVRENSIKKELPVKNSGDPKISQLYCSIFG